MTEQQQKIEAACEMLHMHFEDEANDYSEREASDVEYFVGVIMYNLFGFSKALPTMQTMDVGADFANAGGTTYLRACELIDTIKSDDELELLALLRWHVDRSLEQYADDPMACYLLNRLKNHVANLEGIYAGDVDVNAVDFKNRKGFGI